MKQVVMSEGKHDIVFVQQYAQQYCRNDRVTTFVGEEVEHSRLKNAESSCIRNFLERRNPYDILVKSENGKPALKRVFIKLVNFLVDVDAEVCLLVDLDSRPLEDLVADLDTAVQTNYDGREYAIEHSETIARSDHQIAATGELWSADRCHGAFEILAFTSDLEDVAGIDKEATIAEIEAALEEFVTDASTIGPTHEILGD